MILPLYLHKIILVFSRKELTYRDYLKDFQHSRTVPLGGYVISRLISSPFCMVKLPSYLLMLWPVQVIHSVYSSLKMSDISFKVFLC